MNPFEANIPNLSDNVLNCFLVGEPSERCPYLFKAHGGEIKKIEEPLKTHINVIVQGSSMKFIRWYHPQCNEKFFILVHVNAPDSLKIT